MFATRNHNENAIYEQQTAAAAKPLNQGLKGLAPKTPGNKKSQNDENANFGGGKTGGKGKQTLFGDGKTGKIERNAFVTPAGPRTRAPLGNKTTNAKAGAFNAPAPPSEKLSAKPTSPRMRRAKVKIHQADPIDAEGDGSDRDIERMPPREVPLPDHPDDWPADRTYPQFEGKNLTKGWMSEFQSAMKDSDVEFEQDMMKAEAREKKETERRASAKLLAMKASSKPSTLKSRHAASALTAAPKASYTPSFAAPTTSTKARLPSVISRKPSPFGPGNARHTAAKAASNTTLGYSKGRAVSASARAPLSSIYDAPTETQKASPMKLPFGSGTVLDELLNLSVEDNESNKDSVIDPLAEDGDELEAFRLEPVEL